MDDEYNAMGLTDADKVYMDQENALVAQDGNNQLENPFENAHYKEIKGSDAPIQYGGGMAEVLLNNDAVPTPIKQKYWWVFNNDNVLTFLNENTKQSKLLAYDVAILDTLNSMHSYFDYTFKDELQFDLIRNAFDTKLDRAMGVRENVKNERIIIQSQFNENRNINEVGSANSPIKEGFFKRLLGRR